MRPPRGSENGDGVHVGVDVVVDLDLDGDDDVDGDDPSLTRSSEHRPDEEVANQRGTPKRCGNAEQTATSLLTLFEQRDPGWRPGEGVADGRD